METNVSNEEPDYVLNDFIKKNDTEYDENKILNDIVRDRKGQPLSVDEMRNIQNRLMKRPADFEKWSIPKKNDYLLKELQDYSLGQLPSLEELQELNKKMIPHIVVDGETNIHALNAPRVNLKAENVNLTLTADGKTLTFNNQQALAQYRESIRLKNEKVAHDDKPITPNVGSKQIDTNLGNEIHNNADWE